MKNWDARRSTSGLARVEKWTLLLLLFTLTLQALLIALRDKPFPIPAFLLAQAKEQATAQGLAFTTGKAVFTLDGRITISDIRIHADHGNLPPLAFARQVSVKMKYLSIFSGRFLPSSASFQDAWILADDKADHPVLEKLFGHAWAKGNKLLFHASSQMGSAVINLRGSWTPKKPTKAKTDRKPFESPFLRKNFPTLRQKTLDYVNRAQDWLAQARNPTLYGHLTLGETNRLHILALSDSFTHPNFTSGELQAQATLRKGANSSLAGNFRLDLRHMKRPVKDTNITLDHATLYARDFALAPDRSLTLPSLMGRADGLRLSGSYQATLPTLYLNATPLTLASVPTSLDGNASAPRSSHRLNLFAGMGSGYSLLCLSGSVQPFEPAADLSLRLSLRPEDFESPTLHDWWARNLLRSTTPVRGEIGPIRLRKDRFLGARFHLHAKDLVVRGSPPATYRLQGFFTPEGDLRIPHAYGKLGESEVRGSFEQNFAQNLDYRFLLEGPCLPTELNTWLRPWWDHIWLDFAFGPTPPFGDFEIKGCWKTGGARTRVFGFARFADLTYRELPVETGSLNIVVTPENTLLTRMRITPPQGQAEGRISFPRSRSGQPLALQFDFQGSLNPAHCRRAFGSTAEEALSRFDTNTTVQATASGSVLLTRPNSPEERTLTRIRVEANCSSPIRYSGLPLDHLHIRLQSTADESLLSPLRFGLAGGDGLGTLRFQHDSNDTALNLHLSILQANRARFAHALSLSSAFREPEQDTNASETPNAPTDGRNGTLTLHLQAQGNPEKLWGFEGNGSLLVDDPELHRIPLFGPLSTLLKESPVPIPSGFRFKRLRAPFLLQNEFALFDNLELSGLTSLLLANGKVNLAKDELDFEARLHLLAGISIPLLDKIVKLVDPLSSLANLKISGSFERPEWKAKFSPKAGPFKLLGPSTKKSERSRPSSSF